jgi:hypothetical protein
MAACLIKASRFLVSIGLLLSTAWIVQEARAQAVVDEARQAGRAAQTFTAADEDYFKGMDGAVALTPDEVKGRNMWIVWTGGNDRLWDKLTNLTFGAFDMLKILSSSPGLKYSRDNRWTYLGLVNEPCFTKPTGPDPQRYGLWLDQRNSDCPVDPFTNEQKYPGVAVGARGKNIPVGSYYGYPTGMSGCGFFPTPPSIKRRRLSGTPSVFTATLTTTCQRIWSGRTGSGCPAASVTSGRTRKSRQRTPKLRSGRTSAPPSGRSIFGSTAFWRGTPMSRIFCSRCCIRPGRARWTPRWSRPTVSTTRAR